jgi:hypothetical protein
MVDSLAFQLMLRAPGLPVVSHNGKLPTLIFNFPFQQMNRPFTHSNPQLGQRNRHSKVRKESRIIYICCCIFWEISFIYFGIRPIYSEIGPIFFFLDNYMHLLGQYSLR